MFIGTFLLLTCEHCCKENDHPDCSILIGTVRRYTELYLNSVCVFVCHLLDEERVLVEMACGAALAAVYSGLIRRLQVDGKYSP